MGHSIAAKYAARPEARFVRPSSRARERRLGLGAPCSFFAASERATELHGAPLSAVARLRAGWHGPTAARPSVRGGRPRPLVQMHWARSGLSGAGRRPRAATAPWHA
ncbi:MAG: hypothetical protein OEV61_04490 [Chloroflexota bacterium]|nr:hypothetical protein [Chloroflexota bacterium]MDH5243183.1 hypothetical protein [Chloroflexota bacterium]